MIEPNELDIGRAVVYLAGTERQEVGIITGLAEGLVFVRYGSERHSKGTRRQDLDWEFDLRTG